MDTIDQQLLGRFYVRFRKVVKENGRQRVKTSEIVEALGSNHAVLRQLATTLADRQGLRFGLDSTSTL